MLLRYNQQSRISKMERRRLEFLTWFRPAGFVLIVAMPRDEKTKKNIFEKFPAGQLASSRQPESFPNHNQADC